MLCKRISAALLLLGATILVPAQQAVNLEGNHPVQWADGSPMPVPHPPGALLVADGSPMPVPHPPGAILIADGSPMPVPHPPAPVPA